VVFRRDHRQVGGFHHRLRRHRHRSRLGPFRPNLLQMRCLRCHTWHLAAILCQLARHLLGPHRRQLRRLEAQTLRVFRASGSDLRFLEAAPLIHQVSSLPESLMQECSTNEGWTKIPGRAMTKMIVPPPDSELGATQTRRRHRKVPGAVTPATNLPRMGLRRRSCHPVRATQIGPPLGHRVAPEMTIETSQATRKVVGVPLLPTHLHLCHAAR